MTYQVSVAIPINSTHHLVRRWTTQQLPRLFFFILGVDLILRVMVHGVICSAPSVREAGMAAITRITFRLHAWWARRLEASCTSACCRGLWAHDLADKRVILHC